MLLKLVWPKTASLVNTNLRYGFQHAKPFIYFLFYLFFLFFFRGGSSYKSHKH